MMLERIQAPAEGPSNRHERRPTRQAEIQGKSHGEGDETPQTIQSAQAE